MLQLPTRHINSNGEMKEATPPARWQDVIMLHFCGEPNIAIAKATGYVVGTVSGIVHSPYGKQLLANMQLEQASQATDLKKKYKEMVVKNLDVPRGILEDREEPSSLRLKCFFQLSDRAIGSPTQTINSNKNEGLSADELDQVLDRIHAEKAKNAEPAEVTEISNAE